MKKVPGDRVLHRAKMGTCQLANSSPSSNQFYFRGRRLEFGKGIRDRLTRSRNRGEVWVVRRAQRRHQENEILLGGIAPSIMGMYERATN